MALSLYEAKQAMRIAIEGMLVELEAGVPTVDEHGAMMEFVTAIPAENPKVFGVAYLFVSEDQGRQIELMRRLSGFLAAGLPDTAQNQP